MTPEILHSISAAKGLPMPIEDAQPVNAVAELLRNERRLREMLRRLEKREDVVARQLVERLTRGTQRYFGKTAVGRNSGSVKAVEWTHAECAQACRGLEERYFQALRFTYALDDSVFHSLSTRLWEWALERRESERGWPATVLNLEGESVRYMRDLVDMHMMEVRHPSCFKSDPGGPDPRMLLMNVTERVWRRRLSPVYEAITEEFLVWLAIGAGHMRYMMRDEAA